MDREAWHAAAHEVAKSQTGLSELNWTELMAFCVMKLEVHIKHLCCWPSALFIQWKLLCDCNISHTSHIFQAMSFWKIQPMDKTWLFGCAFGKYYLIVGDENIFPFYPSWVIVAGLIIQLSQNRLTGETVNFNFCTWRSHRNEDEEVAQADDFYMFQTKWKWKLLSCIWLFATPWLGLSVHGFSKKKYYIHTMEYYSAIKKNTYESVLMRWMKLEPIIQSEVSQEKKNKTKHQYSILMHIYGI